MLHHGLVRSTPSSQHITGTKAAKLCWCVCVFSGIFCSEGGSESLHHLGEKFRYRVLGAWPEELWKDNKLTDETYRSYLFSTKDGVCARKRNLEEVQREQTRLTLQKDPCSNSPARAVQVACGTEWRRLRPS